jgi:hypothetical protein
LLAEEAGSTAEEEAVGSEAVDCRVGKKTKE